MFASLDLRTTGMPLLDAQADFRRARRASAAARFARLLTGRSGRPSGPPTLAHTGRLPSGPRRLQVVPLDSIVGTVEPTSQFDARLRPVSDVVRWRWERVALAHRRGLALPPIELRRGSDGHYIVDGRHRVSVARALGLRDIDAWVTSAAGQAATHRSDGRPCPLLRSLPGGDAAGIGPACPERRDPGEPSRDQHDREDGRESLSAA